MEGRLFPAQRGLRDDRFGERQRTRRQRHQPGQNDVTSVVTFPYPLSNLPTFVPPFVIQ